MHASTVPRPVNADCTVHRLCKDVYRVQGRPSNASRVEKLVGNGPVWDRVSRIRLQTLLCAGGSEGGAGAAGGADAAGMQAAA